MPKKVLDVGQCDIDNWNISQLLKRNFDVEVVRAKTHQDAMASIRDDDYALVLVNRINDSDRSEGVGFLEQLKADEQTQGIPVMIISNFAESQTQAVSMGAEMGFGKAALDAPSTVEKLKPFLED